MITILVASIRKVLSNSSQVILAAIICSLVFLSVGIFVGALCHHWARVFIRSCRVKRSTETLTIHEHPTPTDTTADAAPVMYEEVTSHSHSGQKIELTDNVAYGPI